LADKKKEIFDSDIIALVDNQSGSQIQEHWKIKSFHTLGGTGTIPTATIELVHENGDVVQEAATGDGPVDAAFKCLERIVGVSAKLTDYNVRSVSSGKDALGEVSLAIDVEGLTFHGKGVSTDVIEASTHGYLQALNKALSQNRGRRKNSEKGL